MEERMQTQQYPAYPGVRPPRGWVPPLGQWLTLVGVYDNSSGTWVGLPLQALVEGLLVAESLHTEDRIDERDAISVTVPNGSAKDTVKSASVEVPSGEVWYVNRLTIVTEDEVSGNVRVSRWPKADDVEKKYLAQDQPASTTASYDLPAPGELGADLRLVGGDKLTVVGTVTAAGGTTGDRKVTLKLFGRKARRLV